MKKFCGFLGILVGALVNAHADDSTVGMNFVVTHPTSISEIGISDGGVPFTSDVTVGIFNSETGAMVGSDVVFGPGLSEIQSGNTVLESVAPFVLPSGEYSVVAVGDVGSLSGESAGLFNVNTFLDLGASLDLPDAGRFNSGALFDISGYSSTPSNPGNTASFDIVDPVPDGGSTGLALGAILAGVALLRRKLA